MLRKNVNVALVNYLCQGFYALNTLYGTCVTWEFWLTNEISKRRLENALLTEQIERQVLFCTVTSRLMHDDAKKHATLARLYNVLENWREMKTVFGRNILIRTDDILILFDISIRYDYIFILRENYWNDNVRFSVIVKNVILPPTKKWRESHIPWKFRSLLVKNARLVYSV